MHTPPPLRPFTFRSLLTISYPAKYTSRSLIEGSSLVSFTHSMSIFALLINIRNSSMWAMRLFIFNYVIAIGIVRNISICESACQVLQYFAQKFYRCYSVIFIGYILPLISKIKASHMYAVRTYFS